MTIIGPPPPPPPTPAPLTIVSFPSGTIISAGRFGTRPLAINNAGEVIGIVDSPSSGDLFTYINGASTDTGLNLASSLAINNNGQIVGTSASLLGNPSGAFLYGAGKPTQLTFVYPANNSYTVPTAINDLGEVVGVGGNGSTGDFIYSSGNYQAIGTSLGNGGSAIGNIYDAPPDINNAGTIAAGAEIYTKGNYVTPSFVLSDSNVVAGFITQSWINNAGDILANYYTGPFHTASPNARYGSFLYHNGTYTELSDPSAIPAGPDQGYYSFPCTVATGINDLGEVVGVYYKGTTPHGFIYKNGAYADLNVSGSTFTYVTGINNLDQIIGYYDGGGFVAQLSPALFTNGDDTVNFNKIAQGTASQDQIDAVNLRADLYNSLGGNDNVTLPDVANYQLTSSVRWDPTHPFQLGDGTDIITGGNGDETILGGAGQDTFIYDFSKFATGNGSGTVHTITGGHTTFATPQSSQQNVLELPGSPNDYNFSVAFTLDALPTTQTTITTSAAGFEDGFPNVTFKTTDVEKVTFKNPIAGRQVSLTTGNVAVEMLQLASESYGSNKEHHPAGQLAYGPDPIFDLSGNDTFINATGAARTRNWRALSAMELGIAPADFTQGSFEYSFVNGVYQAIDPNPLHRFLPYIMEGDPAEADAIVLTGVVNGKRTLAISFTGSDQVADFWEYLNLKSYYDLFAPLTTAIKAYLAPGSNNRIEQVLVSGHSLGAPMVQYLLNDLPASSFPNAYGYTDGSPGAEAGSIDPRIVNFIHAGYSSGSPYLSLQSILDSIASGHGDPVPMLGQASQDSSTLPQVVEALLNAYSKNNWGLTDTGTVTVLDLLNQNVLNVQPKWRTGGNILIDDDVVNVPTRQAFFGLQHNDDVYTVDLEKIIAFARKDYGSPFASDPVAQKLINNTIPSSTIQIAVGTPGSNIVHVYAGDNYVLGFWSDYYTLTLGQTPPQFSSNTIIWDSPTASETVHVVDGGPGINNTVILTGHISDYFWQSLGNGETYLAYVGSAGTRGVIGHLYRVAYLSFTLDPNQSPVAIVQSNATYLLGTPGQPLAGGDGPLTLDGSLLENQTIRGGNGPINVVAGSNDTITLRTGNDIVFAGPNDTVILGNGNNIVFAAPNDTIILGDGNNLVYGGSNNRITAGNGNNKIFSGDPSTIALGNGDNTVVGQDGDTITAGNGDNHITAGKNSTIVMGNGEDVVIAGAGSAITMGIGRTEDRGQGRELVDTTHDERDRGDFDRHSSENSSVEITAGANSTIVMGDGRAHINAGGGDKVTLGKGDDTVIAADGDTIFAGNGEDQVTAGANSVIKLGNGDDRVTTGDNANVTAGCGDDYVTAGAHSTIVLGSGDDRVESGANSTITVGNGDDRITAGANSVVKLGNGEDRVVAGANNTIFAGKGEDTLAFGVTANSPFGHETIYNFNPREDRIEFNHALFVNFAAVLSHAKQVGQDTVITRDANDTVSLQGVALLSLHANNFHFT